MIARRSIVAVAAGLLACTSGKLAPSDAGTDGAPGACAGGSITFEMHAASASYCTGAPGACSAAWLSLLDPHGTPIAIDPPCMPDCAACEPVGCPALCAAPTRMPPGGVQRAWDGTYYAQGRCGAGLACVTPTCASPGQYVARACAYREDPAGSPAGACTPTPTPTCAEAVFDWPPTPAGATVSTSLDDGGAIACCPAGWLLYACTYPDGGAGWSCHNPALGCASSTTCGEGCDGIVTGRCEGG